MSETSEVTTNWERLAEMHGQWLRFAACDEHLADGLSAIEGRTARVVRITDNMRATRDSFCIDGHAPATWLFYTLGRRWEN